MQSAVAAAYDSLLSRVNPGESAYDGTFQLLNHALFGGGADLILDEDDPFTGLVLNTDVFREGFLGTLMNMIPFVQERNREQQLARTGLHWYNYKTTWGCLLFTDAIYPPQDGADPPFEKKVAGKAENINSYDSAMILLGGDVSAWVSLERTEHGREKNTYRISYLIKDDFDFDGDYSGKKEDASLANALKWLGKLMEFGAVIHPFVWEISFAFEITVPNECSHEEVSGEVIYPQPGVQGYTQHSCSQCGAVWKDSFTDALEGGIVGSWETDIVLPAADLGVETEDARLRCTLTFGTDGAVKADWKAIDLYAFREFYHTLFVNAYYACAYGAGITDLAQVEQACQESNGMSVSDYIYSFLDSFDINALFTPASASGTYRTEGESLYTDLNIMGNPSDPSVPNPFTVEGNTLTWTAASYGMPDYIFLCNRK